MAKKSAIQAASLDVTRAREDSAIGHHPTTIDSYENHKQTSRPNDVDENKAREESIVDVVKPLNYDTDASRSQSTSAGGPHHDIAIDRI